MWALGLPPTCILGPEKWLPFGLHWQVLSGLSMSSSLTMGNSISRTHRQGWCRPCGWAAAGGTDCRVEIGLVSCDGE